MTDKERAVAASAKKDNKAVKGARKDGKKDKKKAASKKTCHLALPASTMLMKRKIRAMKSTTTPPNTSPAPTEQQGTNIKPLRTRSCGTT